jgi:predicted acylesterase/phospholipase RssA
VTISTGQALALRQLRSIELASSQALEILDVIEPSGGGVLLWVNISLDCNGVEHVPGGIQLRDRERISIGIDPGFPFDVPYTQVRHPRWAGSPHVQWRRQLCLYLAPSVEWAPADGMYGFIERLFHWLERASAGTLDAEGAALHPPVAYVTRGAPMVIPRVDTPTVADTAWLGYATLAHPYERRYDLVAWTPEYDPAGELNTPSEGAAAAVLLAAAMDWEFPETVAGLLVALSNRGVDLRGLIAHLGFVAAYRKPGEPLMVIVGTPMRGTVGQLRQHLTAWRIPSANADQLTLTLGRYSKDEQRREVGEGAIDAVLEWASSADAEWCPVREARPEIIQRRDNESPLTVFRGKSVAVWGCGALGAPIAEWVLRAGARRIVLYDNSIVTPGVLVRQPYTDDDLGSPKATALRERLEKIDPTVTLESHVANVATGPLDRDDWHDDAEIVIDATASVIVQAKLERTRRDHPQDIALITAVIGHTAQHGIATIALPDYTGAGADTLRATKLACARNSRLRGFLQEFWPNPPRTDAFQPEPGCSTPTFRGSGAEVNALAGSLLSSVASELSEPPEHDTAISHLIALPLIEHPGASAARLAWPAALTIPDYTGRFEVRISPPVLREIQAWTAAGQRQLEPMSETGGVLFGQRDDATGVIWIDEISGPPSDSNQSPTEFVCGTLGVDDLGKEKSTRTSGSVEFLGMWHTHPGQSADFSARDLIGMLNLLEASESPRAQGLILIVGWAASDPQLGAYVFEHEELQRDHVTISVHEPRPVPVPVPVSRDVGLALSGGGSRAVAFHLGCLRALHDRGVLDRVQVVSGVSGGALMTGLWAYGPEQFEDFDKAVRELLRSGLHRRILRRALLSRRMPQALASSALAAAAGAGARVTGRPGGAAMPRWRSRTDAFADVLAGIFEDALMRDSRLMDGLDVVINACDLRTGHAFRFGSRESGSWTLGRIPDNDVDLATAVAASAAYPLLLPALDRSWLLEKRDGAIARERLALTDGGVFDNLGTSCLRPGRSTQHSYNVFGVDYVISCDAGRGQLAERIPGHLLSRVSRSFEASFRKLQDSGRGALHAHVRNGELKGFVMPYLGQQDKDLPWQPPDLVQRDQVANYPTDFAAMNTNTIDLLASRGEWLTRLLIDAYCPEL